jgi:2,3-bisphosphoglycerate-independent phosphoglycerate mutase
VLAVTADHGNADEMRDPAGGVVTKHSLNPVPLLLAGSPVQGRRLSDGVLADVTPTLMALSGVRPADGMSGRSLLDHEP